MIVAALTGNIGMGKTTALREFEALGAFVVDTDEIVADLLTRPLVINKVLAALPGDDILNPDGTIDKKKVADLVFEDDARLEALEGVLHPLVFVRIDDIVREAKGHPLVVVEVPMLFENGHEARFSKVVTVYADENIALDRLQQRGMERADGVRRLMSQLPITDKIQRSNFIIDNNNEGSEMMKAQVKKVYRALLAVGEG